jgi:general secretion pathway protein C
MKPYYTIINILLITLAVYFSVKGFYKITTAKLDQTHLSEVADRVTTSSKTAVSRPLSAYNPIIERNLFNTQSGTGRQPEQVDFENLKPTSLKLTLLGTVTGDAQKAFAVIQETSGGIQQLYRAGDTIQNARLKMILREKVVLSVNGKDEILEIEKISSKKAARESKRSAGSTSQNISVARSRIEDAARNVNTLMQQARIRPHFTKGKADGISITGIKSKSIFKDMGLKSGDIITSVNGKTIQSVDDVLSLYNSLQSSERVKMELKRRGRLKTIDYDIK